MTVHQWRDESNRLRRKTIREGRGHSYYGERLRRLLADEPRPEYEFDDYEMSWRQIIIAVGVSILLASLIVSL
jgi:hypothetical protein